MSSLCPHRANTGRFQTTIWRAILGAYILVAAAPTMIDLLERLAAGLHQYPILHR
jgi:hypothetical protein